MNTRLLQVIIAAETDIVVVRKRTRRLAELIGFDTQDQTRITTAVSEIVRNAYEYAGGGQIEYRLDVQPAEQSLQIVVRDRGPGIADLSAVLTGAHKSATGMGVGLLGAQRLMDNFHHLEGEWHRSQHGQASATAASGEPAGRLQAHHGRTRGRWSGRCDRGNQQAESSDSTADG
jgi:anti-sigma regulatory factor (Ser/Thr protein kinase)